jgi:DNA-directed RNA polymerase sigma subunit (sigma70/sigma32)
MTAVERCDPAKGGKAQYLRRMVKTVSIRPASLDGPISDDDSTEFGETVGDEDARTPFELLRDKNLRAGENIERASTP